MLHRVCAALLIAYVCGPTALRAATVADIEQIIAKVQSHPQKIQVGKIYYVDLPRKGASSGEMQVLVKDLNASMRAFGIRAVYVVGKVESNYEWDTPCEATLSSIHGTGVVEDVEWKCIAWTPFMEQFVDDNKQRIFDAFVAEAKELLP